MQYLWDDYLMGTADVLAVSHATEGDLRNWQGRGVLTAGRRNLTGRFEFTLFDALRLAVVHDLTTRTRMPASDAAGVAEMFIRHVTDHAARDESGRPVADPSAFTQTKAFTLAVVDGVMLIGLTDSAAHNYTAFGGQYSRAHIVLPVAGIVAEVLLRWLERVA